MLIIFFLLINPVVPTSSGQVLITQTNEPAIDIGANSNLYINIPLINPSDDINAECVIVEGNKLKDIITRKFSDMDFKVDWSKSNFIYYKRPVKGLFETWDDDVAPFLDWLKFAQLLANPPLDVAEIITYFTGEPPEWALKLGDKYKEAVYNNRVKFIECRMTDCDNAGKFSHYISRGKDLYIDYKSYSDGILIPPQTNAVVSIFITSPSKEQDCLLSLDIPYLVASSGIPYSRLLDYSINWQKSINIISYNSVYDFDRDLNGWQRIGSVPPWHTMESGIKWYDQWGGAQGVIVIDACEWSEEGIHAKGGLEKAIIVPENSKTLIANLVKEDHDASIQFSIIDLNGEYILGREFLSGKQQKLVSYDISGWAGKEATVRIINLGAGTDIAGCTTPTCCWEYIGVDWIRID